MKISFYNFGSIKSAELWIKPFTVIAGKNETGKSFVLRTLYGIFSSYHKSGDKGLVSGKFTVGGISARNLEQKLRWIFQQRQIGNLVNKLVEVKEKEEKKATIEIVSERGRSLISMSASQKRKVDFSDEEIILDLVIHHANFIATPLVLDLEKGMSYYKTMFPNNYGIPDIYWDIIKDIKNVGIADTVELEEIYEKIKEIIGGRFEYDPKEGFIFRKGKFKFNVNLVASGIKIFGLVQLLIERNFLGKNTVFIIEEPEVHLHPSLRFKLIDIFRLLSKNGVFVIFSTHSPEIIRYIEYLLRKGELSEENTEILHLIKEPDGSIGKREPQLETIEEILESLTEDYFYLVMKEKLEEGEKKNENK
ncbi:MAG: AAA family ATPase [Desulfurobacteriaceae bacterium]